MRTHKSSLIILVLLLSLGSVAVFAQDLDSLLQGFMEEETEYITATFKATRILNGHSVEQMSEGQMDFRISHRFGLISSGVYEFFGLDQAHIHLSFEYGIKDWIMVGLGRGTFEKTIDGFTKIKLLRQSTGLKEMPLSVSYMGGIYVNGLKWDDTERENYFWQRLDYAHQVLIARKFSPALSLQLTPSYLHQNLVVTAADPNDIFGLGAGGRLKLSKRISINAEYYYLFLPAKETLSTPIYNPFSLGIDIDTGGHVFQIILTNSVGMTENAFLGHTLSRWLDGDIHLGFNISRVFQLKK